MNHPSVVRYEIKPCNGTESYIENRGESQSFFIVELVSSWKLGVDGKIVEYEWF